MGEAMETDETSSEVAPTFHGIPLRDGWQSGEIKPSHPYGLFVGVAIGLAIVMQTVLTQGELTSIQKTLQAAAVLIGALAIWAGGKSTSWNEQGVTAWFYGCQIKAKSWEDVATNQLSRMSLASILQRQDRSPESPSARFHIALQVYKQWADPRKRTFETPPSILRIVGHGLSGIGIAALVTYAVAFAVHSAGLDQAESHMWAKALVLAAFVAGIGCGVTFAVRELRKWREPWRWKPVAEPTFDVRLAKLTSPARELLPGKYYVHKPAATIHQWLDFYVLLIPLTAVVSGSKMLDGWVVPEALALAAAAMTTFCLALSGISEALQKYHKQKKSLVDDTVLIECTENGLRLWKDGESTGYLRYPHPLTTGNIWNRSVLESWSDGETTYTIDRARLAEVPVYFPAASYALTEGNGWTTPESKAIAAQMLAERDWSKPLPKKGQ